MRNIILLITVCLFIGCSKDTLNSSSTGGNETGTGGSLARFTVVGNYLYLVENTTLKTFNITNPASPVLSNSIVIGGNIETIYPYKNNLFIGSQNGMFIYSLANPEAPQMAGTATHVRTCDPVVANDTTAFVTLRSSGFCGAARDGLYIYNITSLINPQLIKTVDLPTPYGLGLKDNTLFVCQGSNGMTVLDVSDTNNPVTIQTITGNDFRDVIPYNSLLICYVADGLALYDISNLSNIQFVKKILN